MMPSNYESIYCDECKRDFVLRSIDIKECLVEIEGNVLLLKYFVCPHCHAVYKVLLVEEAKYQELMNDLDALRKRIHRLHGKGNLMLMQKLHSMLLQKQERIKRYCVSVYKKYPGSFMLATVNKQQEEHIIYLPRDNAEK